MVDGADGVVVVVSAGVAVRAAAFAGAGGGAPWPGGDQVVWFDQLGGEVGDGVGQSGWGERAARVAESRAASKVRLKLICAGSGPECAA